VRAREDAGLDGVVPKVAKRCCSQGRTCATSIEVLGIASVAPVAVFPACVLQPLKLSNGYHPALGSPVVLLGRAKMVFGPSWRGVAVEVGLLSVVATRRGPGCHAANMSHSICVRFLRGPLNFRVGSAIEHATVVFAASVAWRRVRNVRKVDTSAQVEARVTRHFSCAWLGQRRELWELRTRLGCLMGDVSDWSEQRPVGNYWRLVGALK
jgi:hypothetical protein